LSRVARIAILCAVAGVFLTWTSDGPVRLDGTQGPNNGWLVVIVALLALAWVRPLARGSWIGVAGVLGAAVVIGWTAIENWLDGRRVSDGMVGIGLLLVIAASVVLAATATASVSRDVRRLITRRG
jgi:divalent metal cation (Fe/Co/Zn/Cd) transporter